MATGMKHFMVLTQVGPHLPGEVIAISPENEKAGILPERLIALNAVREATEDESGDAVLWGTNDPDRYLQPIPQVEPKLPAVLAEQESPVKTSKTGYK